MTLSTFLTFAFLISTALTLCPPPGALLPPPSLNSGTSGFSIPDSVFNGLPFRANTSFAIKASIGKTTVFQYEFSAPGREVPQTLFKTKSRIASVNKMITALALTLSADKISLEDPITKFIPGLRKDAYRDVTVGALTSHTSGLGRFVSLAPCPGISRVKLTVARRAMWAI